MPAPADLVRGSHLPQHEAERLLIVASGLSKAQLLSEDSVAGDVVERFVDLVKRRGSGVPLQYLEGSVQFGPLELVTDPRALIPRPETERLWERVVELVGGRSPGVIVDLCTGSGNLALALKHRFRDASVYASDISVDALSLGAQNAVLTGLDVSFLHGDLFDPLPGALRGRVDLLVANPPYIAAGVLDSLPAEVRDHEPVGALIAGPSGDEVLRRIAGSAGEWVRPGGLVACEIAADQGARARELFASFDVVVEPDLAGRDRFVLARPRVD